MPFIGQPCGGGPSLAYHFDGVTAAGYLCYHRSLMGVHLAHIMRLARKAGANAVLRTAQAAFCLCYHSLGHGDREIFLHAAPRRRFFFFFLHICRALFFCTRTHARVSLRLSDRTLASVILGRCYRRASQ